MVEDALRQRPPDASQQSDQSSNISDDDDVQDLSDDGTFTKVTTKKRRRKLSGNSSESASTVVYNRCDFPGLTVIVKPKDPSKQMKRLNPLHLNEHLDSIAPDGVISIRPNYRLNLLAVDTRNTESTKALLNLTSICGIAVHAYAPQSRESAVGIVYDVTKDITEEELNLTLRGKAPIVQVRRLGATSVLKVVFATSKLPEYVTLGYVRFKVYPYIEKPLQCIKCHQFGHISSACDKPFLCSRCGGAHARSDCTSEDPRCSNCRKDHESTSHHCKVFQNEQTILQYCRGHNVDYITAKSTLSKATKHSTSAQVHSFDRNHAVDFPALPASRTTSFNVKEHNTHSTSSLSTQPHLKTAESTHATAQDKHRKKTPAATPGAIGFGSLVSRLIQSIREFLVPLASPIAQCVLTILDFIAPLIVFCSG